MSQGGIIRNGSAGLGSVDTLTGDSGGAVGPDGANNINIVSGAGLTTTGNPGANTITISQDNAVEGTGTTVGNVTDDIITLSLGATPGVYTIEARIVGFESTTPAGVGYQLFGTVRTDGATATLIELPDIISNEDTVLQPEADVDLVVSGNDAIIEVTGQTGFTINWRAFMLYTRVT